MNKESQSIKKRTQRKILIEDNFSTLTAAKTLYFTELFDELYFTKLLYFTVRIYQRACTLNELAKLFRVGSLKW
jgi:hypothetical protein